MIADILSAFPQQSIDNILYKMDYNTVTVWFHMARFAKYQTSIPEIFRTMHGEKESEDIRKTHVRHPTLGWIRKKDK